MPIFTVSLRLTMLGIISLWLATIVQATERQIDAGIILGDPTGISMKTWQDGAHAIDIAVGWKTGQVDEFQLHADYLTHDENLFGPEYKYIPFYYGIGARLYDKETKRKRFGLRLPVGVEYLPQQFPLALFFELVPRLDITPSTNLSIDTGLGLRYRF